jgi:hypothetical protein
MTPRRLSFAGCQSRDDAIAAIAAFLDQIGTDHRRAAVTRWLIDAPDDPIDIDALDALIDWWQAHDRRVTDAVCQQVRGLVARRRAAR